MKIPIEFRWALADTRYYVGFQLRRLADRFCAPPLSLSDAPMNILLREAAHRCSAQSGRYFVQYPQARVLVTAIQYDSETRYRMAADEARAAIESATSDKLQRASV